jgi:hypothetical protein
MRNSNCIAIRGVDLTTDLLRRECSQLFDIRHQTGQHKTTPHLISARSPGRLAGVCREGKRGMDNAWQWISSLIGLAISIGIAYWIFNDARQRGKSGIIWGILGFFFSLITLIVWLFVRPKTMRAV